MAILPLVCICLVSLSFSRCASPPPDESDRDTTVTSVAVDTIAKPHYPHLDTARAYIGTLEQGNNRGPEVERFLASVHLTGGNPYCAAFVSYVLTAVSARAPPVRSAVARDFVLPSSIPARRVARGGWTPPPGTILTWQKGNTWRGHTGFVVDWTGVSGTTIEANTSSGVYGSQRDGDGVWQRERRIDASSYFRITDFTVVAP